MTKRQTKAETNRKTVSKKAVTRKATSKPKTAKPRVDAKSPARKTVAKKTVAKKTVARKTAVKPTTAKKTTVRKTAAQKKPVRKPVSSKSLSTKTPRPAAKKSALKKPVLKKPTPRKPVKKAVLKTPVKKPVTRKPVAATAKATPVKTATPIKAAKPVSRKETVTTLREHVDGIVSRLKAADTRTRNNVKALETAFSALEKQVQKHQSINHSELGARVDQLSAHLTKTLDTTKQDIASDLKSVLETPTASGIEAVIARNEQRLTNAEISQAQALSKINGHIADLARIIDARFQSQESKAQTQYEKILTLEEQLTSVQSQSYERIRLVENTTADAMRKLGDQVVSAAGSFQTKLDNQNATLKQRIEAIAAQTQQDFDKQSTELSQRMETIEGSHTNQNNYIDRSISKLAARIDNLEYGLSQIPEPAPAPVITPPAAPDIAYATTEADVSSNVDNQSELDPFTAADAELKADGQNTAVQPDVYTGPIDAYTPPPQPAIPAQTPAPVAIPAQIAPPTQNPDGSAPQEYQPAAYQPATSPQHHYVDPSQAAYAPQSQGQTAYEYDPYQAQNQSPQQAQSPYQEAPSPYSDSAPQTYDYSQNADGPAEFVPPVSDNDLPYANPGYGEGETPEGMTRPGHVTETPQKTKKKRKKSSKSKPALSSALSSLPLTPRNLRVAGLALALTAAGYLGLRGFMGNKAPDQPPPAAIAAASETITPQIQVPATGAASDISTITPIGNYQDNGSAATGTATEVAFNGDRSLEDAAESGNPIAQFQLGVSYLDAGQTKQGLKYIRASANQGQPAAQYRLAKLYEAGIGVTADAETARELTERAAREGNRIAMHDLGLYYAEGRGGVDRNLKTALSWFEKAAERGVVDSQYNLGILFGSTPEITTDSVAAYVWFSIAAKQGDQFALDQLGTVKAQLSAAQLKQAENRIASFKPVGIDEEANGIFRSVPWSVPEAKSIAPTTDLVRDAQTLLGQLGYDVGTPDGDMGPKTRTAVTAFERANGLPETGVVTGSLIGRLEAAAGV